MVEAPHDRRILVISEIGAGPPYLGNRARMALLLAAIRNDGYSVHFAGVDMAPDEKRALLPRIDRWVADFTTARPAAWRHAIPRALARFRGQDYDPMPPGSQDEESLDRRMDPRWVDQMRAIQIRESYTRVFVAYVFHSAFLNAFGLDCLKILDTHDIFGERQARLEAAGLTDNWFSTTSDQEREGLLRADRIIAIQDAERRVFERLVGGRREVHTVGHMQPARFVEHEAHSSNRIGYFASDNTLNLQSLSWFLERCWPLILTRCPAARLVVGGRICRLIDTPRTGVELLGEVSDPMNFHARSLFSINPMPGGTGLKIKTVEALAAGRPVVTFESGAAGLDVLVGRGLTVVANADEFVETCVRLLQDPAAARALGRSLPATMEELNAAWRDELRRTLER